MPFGLPKLFKKRVTVGILIGTAILLVVWDLFASPTESTLLAHFTAKSMAACWAFGMLLGHWIWAWKGPGPAPDAIPWKIVVNFSFLGLLVGWDVGYNFIHPVLGILRVPALWPVVGYFFGHYFWGQR